MIRLEITAIATSPGGTIETNIETTSYYYPMNLVSPNMEAVVEYTRMPDGALYDHFGDAETVPILPQPFEQRLLVGGDTKLAAEQNAAVFHDYLGQKKILYAETHEGRVEYFCKARLQRVDDTLSDDPKADPFWHEVALYWAPVTNWEATV